MGVDIYVDYQHSLAYRGVVDFDDLIRLALEALRRDPITWPACGSAGPTSSRRGPRLQQAPRRDPTPAGRRKRQLGALGDPNQAIYETFTNADPRFLVSS